MALLVDFAVVFWIIVIWF